MDVVIPLFAFLLGLGVYRWVSRLWRAVVRDIAVRAGLDWAVKEVRRETARVDVVLLDAEGLAAHLQREDVRREIEELIQDTRR